MSARRNAAAVAALLAVASSGHAANDAAVEKHFAGKTITFIVGYPPGGANDTFARLVGRWFGAFVPGAPRVVIQNMPGAGSATAANYLFNVAPKDGLALALLVPTLALEERMGVSSVKYRSAEFSWIGRMATAPNVTFLMNTAKVKTIADAMTQEATLGATGASATNAIYPAIANKVLGTRFRMVMGYQGSAAAMLAMERGEIEGHSPTLDTLTSFRPTWLGEGAVNVIVQYMMARHAELPNVPTAVELATSEDHRKALSFAVASGDIGKFVVAPPGVDPDTKEALRRSFDRMVRDAAFLADARAQRVGIDPATGEALEALVRDVATAPRDIAETIKAFYPR
jgi:tripartite-type tricarboxylate transporter receptor subunit TctC